jgi:hypothetical protein
VRLTEDISRQATIYSALLIPVLSLGSRTGIARIGGGRIARSIGNGGSVRTVRSCRSGRRYATRFTGLLAIQLLKSVSEGHGCPSFYEELFPVLLDSWSPGLFACFRGLGGCCTVTQTLLSSPRRIEYGQEGPNSYSKMKAAVPNWCGQSRGYIRCSKAKDNESHIRRHR